MRKTDDGLVPLFRQYMAGTLTEEDRRAFLQIVANEHAEEAIKDLLDQEITRFNAGTDQPPGLSEEQAAFIFAQITRTAATVRIRRRFRRLLAAAAVVSLLVAGVYFLKPREDQPATMADNSNHKHDVMPGTSGAVLTLANGQQVLLDSLGNGTVASQGATAITKQNNGIAYHGSTGSGEVVYNTLSTPRARQFQLSLPDGTRVWLNAASSITFPTVFTGSNRMVSVTGEMYFEVEPDKNHPFIVQYGNKRVEVLGTHFNVNAYDDEPDSRVTLLEGAVTVSNGAASNTLRPGQQAILSKTAEGIKLDRSVDMEEVMAWKDGRFDFRETDLKTLMRQLMRWYDVEVSYQPGIPERYFTADISKDKNLSSVLQILELNKIHFKLDNRKIIVTP